MHQIKSHIHVNIPFEMLHASYLPTFLEHGINPEIGFDAHSLDRYEHAHFADTARQLQGRGLLITLHAPFADLSPGSPDRWCSVSYSRRRS